MWRMPMRGGCAELMVTFEDYCVPVVTKVSSIELAMLHDVGMVGLASTMTKVSVEVGSDVVVLGCGPVGLSAVQGARIQGAAQIIAVERDANDDRRPSLNAQRVPDRTRLSREESLPRAVGNQDRVLAAFLCFLRQERPAEGR